MAMISSSFRSRVRTSIEQPAGRVFSRLGLTPNALTLIGFLIAVVAAYTATIMLWPIAGLLVAFGAIFDLFDGALARATGRTSRFGAFLDSTLDRAGEAIVYAGVAYGFLNYGLALGGLLALLAMAASFMVSYVRAKSESLGFSPGSGMANVGLAPREVRVVILIIGLLFAYVGRPINDYVVDYPVLMAALALIAVLATITTIQRILFVYRQSKSQEDSH